MNRQKCKKLMPVFQAFAEGKDIERQMSRSPDKWEVQSYIYPDGFYQYRIKQTPKYRPWTFKEVLVGALLMTKDSGIVVILGATQQSMQYAGYFSLATLTFENALAEGFTYSIDGGKTWHPCGILE